MSSTNKSKYRYYCIVNASTDFRNIPILSKIVDPYDVSIMSKLFDKSEECVISCASFVKYVMAEINKNGDTYKLLWDVIDKKDVGLNPDKEVTVAKFYLVDKSQIGKSVADLVAMFSASVVRLGDDVSYTLSETSFSEKNQLN